MACMATVGAFFDVTSLEAGLSGWVDGRGEPACLRWIWDGGEQEEGAVAKRKQPKTASRVDLILVLSPFSFPSRLLTGWER